MNKFLVLAALLGASFGAGAQSLDDVNKLLGDQKLSEAKVAIDKHIAEPKNATNPDRKMTITIMMTTHAPNAPASP